MHPRKQHTRHAHPGQTRHKTAPVSYRARPHAALLAVFIAMAPASTARAQEMPASPPSSATPASPGATHPMAPATQPPDLTVDGVLRASLPGFVAGLGSGTALAVTGWAIRKLTARRSAP
ncbi:hypothetical protein [Streptomyces sp. NPDC053079]|uniref:hypothetical protein n=1 Tax=Streptomyces sp. NPDC053079 TaxID=3365697 RepID=UPI0037CCCB9E